MALSRVSTTRFAFSLVCWHLKGLLKSCVKSNPDWDLTRHDRQSFKIKGPDWCIRRCCPSPHEVSVAGLKHQRLQIYLMQNARVWVCKNIIGESVGFRIMLVNFVLFLCLLDCLVIPKKFSPTGRQSRRLHISQPFRLEQGIIISHLEKEFPTKILRK